MTQTTRGYSATCKSARGPWFVGGLVFLFLSVAPTGGNAQPAYKFVFGSPECNETMYADIVGKAFQSGMMIWVEVPQWRQLGDETVRKQLLNAILQDGLGICKGKGISPGLAAVAVRYSGKTVLTAWISAADRRWVVSHDNVQKMIAQEAQDETERREREAAGKARQAAEKKLHEERVAAVAKVAAEKAKVRQAALADCGASPRLSGGPWFSSTYSVAAKDQARSERYLCIKSVEYISAAPNPFGGKAARARITGYTSYDFQPVVEVIDFAY